MRRPLFTPEELEELKRIDAELDALPVTPAEYAALEFIEELLFPEKATARKEKDRARRRSYYEAHRKKCLEVGRTYYREHKDEIAARKARFYQENKERIDAQQREYRIRTGKTRTPEQREADKLARAEARKAKVKQDIRTPEQRERRRQYQIAYRARKKGMTVEEYVAAQEAKRKAVEAATAGATDEVSRKRAYQKAYREAHKDELRAYQKAYHRNRRAGQRQQLPSLAMA